MFQLFLLSGKIILYKWFLTFYTKLSLIVYIYKACINCINNKGVVVIITLFVFCSVIIIALIGLTLEVLRAIDKEQIVNQSATNIGTRSFVKFKNAYFSVPFSF